MRQIDADALMETIGCELGWFTAHEDGTLTIGGESKETAVCKYKEIEEIISTAPTIDAEPCWIPCDDRLPEIGEGFCSKDVIVALDDGGIAFTCLEATLFGSVCWQIERMNEIEDGKEINVIAWMPLPEPWKGSDDGR